MNESIYFYVRYMLVVIAHSDQDYIKLKVGWCMI